MFWEKIRNSIIFHLRIMIFTPVKNHILRNIVSVMGSLSNLLGAFIICNVVKYREIVLIYNVYFIFSLVKI